LQIRLEIPAVAEEPATNSFGLWDAVNGGYFADLILNGTNIQSPALTASVNMSYKEVGRAAIVVRSFVYANQFARAHYDNNTIDGQCG
jgi:hypothetical protein